MSWSIETLAAPLTDQFKMMMSPARITLAELVKLLTDKAVTLAVVVPLVENVLAPLIVLVALVVFVPFVVLVAVFEDISFAPPSTTSPMASTEASPSPDAPASFFGVE